MKKLAALAVAIFIIALGGCAAAQPTAPVTAPAGVTAPVRVTAVALAETSAQAEPSAPATPSAAFSFVRRTVVSGTQPQFRYSTRNLPGGSQIFLQLQYGTPPAWTYVETLHNAAGTATLPALPVGLYLFRIRVLNGIDPVATTATQYLSIVAASTSSGCTICQLFGGIGGAIASWVLQKAVPWIISLLPW